MFPKAIIAIQARSTSSRFYNKHVEKIGKKSIIEHVLSACRNSAEYLNRYADKQGFTTEVALLLPDGDPLGDFVELSDCDHIIYGKGVLENDVLGRYHRGASLLGAQYICRITGDCPLIPSHIISKAILLAVKNKYDYISNVDERYRTALDGIDCEVISQRLLNWMHDVAADERDREHVTLLAREAPPEWAKLGFITGFFDFSHIKLSVDTPEDLKVIRDHHAKMVHRQKEAEKVFGKEHIHRF